MASEGAKNFRPKPYSERGRRTERRRSFLGIVTDTVKGLFQSSWLEQPFQTPTDTDQSQEQKRNHIQQTGNSTSSVEPNLGQSYVQPVMCPSSALPGPSKLLPQMPIGLTASSSSVSGLPRLDHQSSAQRQDHLAFSTDVPFGQFDDKSTSLIVNGGDNQSEFSDCSVSTSGCSSMAGNQDKDFQQETSRLPKTHFRKPDFGNSRSTQKRAESSFLWSSSVSKPPSNKSSTSRSISQTTSQSRTPSFNISVFGSPLLKTTATHGSSNDSHFYPGKTVFGGSSSQNKRKLHEISPKLTPSKRQVHAKPVSSSVSGVTSTSAKRILSVLERMSSPLQDAKKIPSYNSSLADSPLSFTPSTIASAAKRRSVPHRIGSSLLKGPPVYALVTPGRVHIAKNYQSSTRPSETYSEKDSAQKQTDPPKSSSLPKFTSTTHSYGEYSIGGGSRPGKVKQPRSQHYSSKKDDDEVVVAPDLPTKFTLPVSSVPKFSFESVTYSNQQSTASQTKSTDSDGMYTFSTPIPQSKPDPATSCPVQNFQFSSPITMDTLPSSSTCQKATVSPSFTDHQVNTSKPDLSFKFNPATAKPKSGSNTNSGLNSATTPATECLFKPAGELKSGSVMDVLGHKTQESTSQTTSNSSVSDGKKDETKNVDTNSCKINGGETKSSDKPSLSELFKKPSNTWECPTCMIRNKEESAKCVACETAKPGASASAKPVTSEPVPNIPVDKSLAEKFKKPAGSWECETCMVSNPSTATKCVACETPKPGQKKATSFITQGGFQFKPSTSASSDSPITSGFGQASSQDKTDGGFKFGASLGSKQTSDTTKVDESSNTDASKSGGFTFGQTLGSAGVSSANSATGGFVFGQSLTSNNNKTEPGFTGGFKFGAAVQSGESKKEESTTSTSGFTFGQPTSTSSSPAGSSKPFENKAPEPASGFTFGDIKAGQSGRTIKTDSAASGMFQFGANEKPVDSKDKVVDDATKPSTESNIFSVSAASTVSAATSGFSKTSESTSSTETKPLFTFGSSDKKDGAATASSSASSLFKFGQTSSTSNNTALGVPQLPDKTATSSAASDIVSTSTTSLVTFGATAAKSQEATKPANSSPFVFGQSTQPGGGLTFGAPSTQSGTGTAFGSQPTEATGSAIFGSLSSQPAGSTGLAGQPAHPLQPAGGGMGLGGQPAPSAVSTGFGDQTATASTSAPTFTFGAAAAASSSGPSAAPAFSFSAKPSNKLDQPTTSANPVFNLTGTTSASTASSTNLFTFTAGKQESPMSAQPSLTNASPFQFGQSSTSSASLFNKSATTTATTTSTFMFGQPVSTTPALATFGSQSAAASAFGGFTKSASTPTFGSTAKTAAEGVLGINAAPAFGTPTPAFGSAAPAPAFGSVTSPPAFGVTTTVAPAFGTPSQQTKPATVFGQGTPTPSFQFGSQQPAPAAPTASVFQFGQTGQQAASPSTGFSFNAPTPNPSAASTPVAPTFGSGTRVNTEFSFNAPTGSSGNPFSVTTSNRRIKAARRKFHKK